MASSQLGSCFSTFRFPVYRILPVLNYLLAKIGIPPVAPQIIRDRIADRMFAIRTGFSVGTLVPLAFTRLPGTGFRPCVLSRGPRVRPGKQGPKSLRENQRGGRTTGNRVRRDCPWLRMSVLRRDRYRCRVCARKGDEITLHVCPTQPLGSHSQAMVTLCANCQRLLENLGPNEERTRLCLPPRQEDRIFIPRTTQRTQ